MKRRVFAPLFLACLFLLAASGESFAQLTPVGDASPTIELEFSPVKGEGEQTTTGEPVLNYSTDPWNKDELLSDNVRCYGDCDEGAKGKADSVPVPVKVRIALPPWNTKTYSGKLRLHGGDKTEGITFDGSSYLIFDYTVGPPDNEWSYYTVNVLVSGCEPNVCPIPIKLRTVEGELQGSDTEYIYHTNNPEGRCEKCESQTNAADCTASPVYPASGNLVRTYTDIYIPDLGMPLEVTRTYNSQDNDNKSGGDFESSFGWGWTSTLATVKLYDPNPYNPSEVLIRFSNGKRLRFDKTNNLQGAAGTDAVYEVLQDNGDGTYTLNPACPSCGSTSRLTYNFDTNGLLESMEDSNGNTTTFTYVAGKLTTVTSPSGRTLTITYTGDKIQTVTAEGTRTYTYGYTGDDLTSVTDPESGVTTYTYDAYHNLTSVTDPEGNTALSVTYYNSDRVYTITEYGKTHSYIYHKDPYYNNNALTTKIDARGNRYKYYYNSYGNITRTIFADGARKHYSVNADTADITKSTNSLNAETSYTYNSKGYILTETDALGHVTTYTYYGDSKFNQVKTKTDPKGRVTTYDYDSQGNLTEETNALGDSVLYSHDNKGQVLKKTDERGNITRYEYDANGRQTKITDALNNITQYEYDTWGNRTKMTDPRGKVTCYNYDDLNRLTSEVRNVGDTDCAADGDDVVTSYSYDKVGNRTAVTDPEGNLTCYVYNSKNQLVKEIRNVGDTDCAIDGDDVVTSYTYDAEGNRASVTDPEGRLTCYEYDENNRLIQEIRNVGDTSCGADSDDVVTSYEYDTEGNRTSVTGPEGNKTSYAYDELNRLISETDALGNTTAYVYDAVGNREKVTDAAGKITYSWYDGLNRLFKECRKVGDTSLIPDGDDAVTRYTYDAAGNRISETDPNGNTTTYTYDALNRLTQMTNALNESEIYSYDAAGNRVKVTAPNGNVTTYTYDDLNRLTGVSDSLGTVAAYGYDKNGNKTSETDPNSNTTTYAYDDLNRLETVTDAFTETTTYTYDKAGNRTQVTDREGNITTYAYDDLNRLVTETRDAGGLDIATAYQYDKDGNRTAITDDNNNTTTYTYDAMNRLTQESYADGESVAYTYDAVGNRLTRTDQAGAVTSYTYDDLHRLTLRDYPGSNDDSFTYDPGGRMVTADNSLTTIRYTYDAINRVTEERQGGETVSYAHDTAARTRQITYPGNRVVVETRDVRNRLDTVTEGASTLADYTYTGARLTTLDYLNGTTATYTYNANNWVTDLAHYKGATRISEFEYGFDKEGNRKYAERLHDTGNSELYTYDAAYRLTNAKWGILNAGKDDIPAPVTETTYNLDSVGNWDSKTTNGSTENRTHNSVNELTARDATPLTYEDKGNLLDDDTNTHEYDYENRLTKVTRNSDSQVLAEFKYDALGRRVEKNDVLAAVVTKYYLDGSRVIEEQVGGSTAMTYVYGNGIDEALQMENGAVYYYHPNTLGTIDALTDSAGSAAEYYRYDAYGDPSVYDSGWVLQGSSSTVDNPYLFTARRWDDEIATYYYRARHYSPTLGRFLQRDPLGYVDGMNLYEYVRSNPTNGVDSLGHVTSFFTESVSWTELDPIWDDFLGKTKGMLTYSVWGNSTDCGMSVSHYLDSSTVMSSGAGGGVSYYGNSDATWFTTNDPDDRCCCKKSGKEIQALYVIFIHVIGIDAQPQITLSPNFTWVGTGGSLGGISFSGGKEYSHVKLMVRGCPNAAESDLVCNTVTEEVFHNDEITSAHKVPLLGNAEHVYSLTEIGDH